jgi:hypothetical protein
LPAFIVFNDVLCEAACTSSIGPSLQFERAASKTAYPAKVIIESSARQRLSAADANVLKLVVVVGHGVKFG